MFDKTTKLANQYFGATNFDIYRAERDAAELQIEQLKIEIAGYRAEQIQTAEFLRGNAAEIEKLKAALGIALSAMDSAKNVEHLYIAREAAREALK